MLLRVPALEILRGGHDQIVHTSHRFTLKEIRTLLEKSGFEIKLISYMNFFTFPVTLLRRILSRRRNNISSDIDSLPSFVNWLLKYSLILESVLLRYITFPIGISIVAVARKK